MLKLLASILLVSMTFAHPVSERISENWLQRLQKRSKRDVPFDLSLRVKNSTVRSSKFITVGRSDFIECDIGGHPVPTIHWLKDGHVIPNSQVTYSSNEMRTGLMMIKARLYLDEVTPEQAGLYSCIAENSHSITHKDTKVEIVASNKYEARYSADEKYAARITAWTSSLLQGEGKDVQLLCRSEGKPTPITVWSTPKENKVKNNSKYQIKENGDLVIKNISWDDMGDYVCQSKNSLGSKEVEIFLYPLSNGDDE